MTQKRVIGIGETVLDILFKNDQPQKAVPGGSTFNSIVSLGRAGVPCAMMTEVGCLPPREGQVAYHAGFLGRAQRRAIPVL